MSGLSSLVVISLNKFGAQILRKQFILMVSCGKKSSRIRFFDKKIPILNLKDLHKKQSHLSTNRIRAGTRDRIQRTEKIENQMIEKMTIRPKKQKTKRPFIRV